MAISKRLRYEVLRRDDYTCRYCGARAPEVRLVVDAVVPEALGGSHKDPANLRASCEPCNSGKTSSSPDAPLVAEVSDAALKWAAAMREAQAAALADIEARESGRAMFEEWWNSWGYGTSGNFTPYPKDPGWRVTVDQLVGAGLPLLALQDCIDLAMTRRTVKADGKFRYMCGIAWGKLRDMQDAAHKIAGGVPAAGPAVPEAGLIEEGRLGLARELLCEISDEESAYFLECSAVNEFLDEDEQRTETEETCEAISSALNSARCNLEWLVGKVRTTFKNLPPEIGEPCLADMKTSAGIGDPLSRMAHEAWGGLLALDDLIDLREAAAWSNQLSEQELGEWLQFARARWADAELSDPRLLVRAWDCARVIAEGKHFTKMCSAKGTYIPDCPARGTHYALIAEMGCCGPDRAEDHEGHLVCERHLEQLMDGTFAGRSGKIFSAIDFTEVPAPKTVPF